MSNEVADSSPISRRGVLLGTAALATAATSLPVGLGDIPGFPICTASVATAAPLPRAGAAAAPAKYRRWSISDPAFPPRVLDSYKKAIRAMLALPPTDPRNWYRHMLIHALDCPHANWWFLPWHRGYLGWFERICRDLSGDPQFALPYWDWTKEPRVPKQMFEDVLNPNDPAYIKAGAEFRAKFTDPVAKASYWSLVRNPDGSQGPSPQFVALIQRFVRFPQDLWFDMLDSPMGPQWFDQPNARGLTAAQPDLTIPGAPADQQAVLVAISSQTINDALAPRDFVAFGGARSNGHSSPSGSSVLEGQPHNLVHSCVGGAFNGGGGFMSANLSPVDPIFFLHHANVDRLWDVWTRKQLALNLPILPDGYLVKPGQPPGQPGQPPGQPGRPPGQDSDYARWAGEPFMFYIDAKGNPVPQNTAGAYASIGDFDYDYSPGTGEQVVPGATAPLLLSQLLEKPLQADLNARSLAGMNAAEASVRLPLALLQQQTEPHQPKLFATVTLNLPQRGHQDFNVFVDRGDGSSQFVATLSMFGHHVMQGPVTFTVPLTAALESVQSRAMVGGGSPTLQFRVVPRARGAAEGRAAHLHATVGAGSAGEVTNISVQQL
jgi:tyrosinase